MKKIFILLIAVLMVSAVGAQQTLKEALYGGRLKNDSGSVVKKTDDLKTKIDTSQKKTEEIRAKDSIAKAVVKEDSVKLERIKENVVVASKEIAKDNNTVWKDFMDKLSTDIRTEVMTSKKIKDGTYSVLLNYEIGVDGHVSVISVSSDPSNSFLESQVKERITLNAPVLSPAVTATGKPRKVSKKQVLTFSK
ncbi:MAG: hypothetical protein J0L56_01495 [Chitinophagales bacterium]|nr:hypothetical protein [Chitinophagales bacterium]